MNRRRFSWERASARDRTERRRSVAFLVAYALFVVGMLAFTYPRCFHDHPERASPAAHAGDPRTPHTR